MGLWESKKVLGREWRCSEPGSFDCLERKRQMRGRHYKWGVIAVIGTAHHEDPGMGVPHRGSCKIRMGIPVSGKELHKHKQACGRVLGRQIGGSLRMHVSGEQGVRWNPSSGRKGVMKELIHPTSHTHGGQPGVLGFRHPAEGLRGGCGLQFSLSYQMEALSVQGGPGGHHSWYPLNEKDFEAGRTHGQLSPPTDLELPTFPRDS